MKIGQFVSVLLYLLLPKIHGKFQYAVLASLNNKNHKQEEKSNDKPDFRPDVNLFAKEQEIKCCKCGTEDMKNVHTEVFSLEH